MLQVFAERDNVAVYLLDPAVAAEDFEGGSKAGENGVRADNAFFGETRHPFVNPAGKLGEDIPPIADFVRPERTVGILARAADEMDGGSEARLALRCNAGLHLGVNRP